MKDVEKKKIRLATTIVALFAIFIIALGVLLPVYGEKTNYYWSEYDNFDIQSIETIEVKNNEFKILQLTDLHYFMPHLQSKTDNIVKKLVEENHPDMIILTGDNVFGPVNTWLTKHVTEFFDSFGLPWAAVYGNHDDEGKADKYWLGEQYENAKYCLYHNGPVNIGGLGNYAVNLTKDGQPFYSLLMMDSNSYIKYNGKKEYATFTPAQVTWYEWLINGLKDNGYDKSMMFFHIPLPEYSDAYDLWEEGGFDSAIGFGEKREEECVSPYNSGMFAKMVELQSTTHTFAGHDHINNYSVKYQGITLSYGLKASTQIYHDKDMIGGTLITIKSDKSVTVEHKYID